MGRVAKDRACRTSCLMQANVEDFDLRLGLASKISVLPHPAEVDKDLPTSVDKYLPTFIATMGCHSCYTQKSTHLACCSCRLVLKPGKLPQLYDIIHHKHTCAVLQLTPTSCLSQVNTLPCVFMIFDLTSFKRQLELEVWVSLPCWMLCPVENRLRHQALTHKML